MKTVLLIGTFDTKEEELLYLKQALQKCGLRVLTLDCGFLPARIKADITSDEIIRRSGETTGGCFQSKNDKAQIMQAMTEGMRRFLPELFAGGVVDGVIAAGGSSGTALAAAGMRPLPLGVPKLIVSTMANGDVTRFVGDSDILMMPSLVDIAGLNDILRRVLCQAAGIMQGMLSAEEERGQGISIAMTMFGVTTKCGMAVRSALERAGYETLVFHANGAGGRLMERLIREGRVEGVIDMTTTELCDELFGGILSAGPQRMLAAGEMRIPQVISVGALDMVNFGSYESVPEKYIGRKLYRHNSATTLMRTTREESAQLGRELSLKLNTGGGAKVLLFPMRGVSELDKVGEPFYDPDADLTLLNALEVNLDPNKVQLRKLDAHINDSCFADALASEMIQLMKGRNE